MQKVLAMEEDVQVELKMVIEAVQEELNSGRINMTPLIRVLERNLVC